ncbi:LOW QUALITY PROTEIN: hypothetical protein V2J09_019732 [Rumex salicifolius]
MICKNQGAREGGGRRKKSPSTVGVGTQPLTSPHLTSLYLCRLFDNLYTLPTVLSCSFLFSVILQIQRQHDFTKQQVALFDDWIKFSLFGARDNKQRLASRRNRRNANLLHI